MQAGGYSPGRAPQGGGSAPAPARSSHSQQGYGGTMVSRVPSSTTGTMYTGRQSYSRAPSEASAGGSEVGENNETTLRLACLCGARAQKQLDNVVLLAS